VPNGAVAYSPKPETDRHAVADGLDITVQGSSFEDTKRKMESALNDYVESLVRKPYINSQKITA